MNPTCPCCGHQSEKAPPFFVDEDGCAIHVDGKAVSVTALQAKMMATIASKYPHTATREFIIDRAYGDDPSGGPEYARKIVDIVVHQVRQKLKGTPLSIKNVWGIGYRFEMKSEG